MSAPNPNQKFPLKGYNKLCFLKNVITRPNIIVGDYTYYDDINGIESFENNVKYHFDFIGDQLIIGKFCSIAAATTFIMNGGNHLTESVSSFPFAIFGEDWSQAMDGKSYPTKGNTVVGNDVWIGYNATIMPGVTIGDGAIIAANATVVKDVAPYSIVGGNPAKVIKKRFSDEKISELLNMQWWNWDIDKITENLSRLTDKYSE